jgi:triacylglycerol lipase
LSPALVVASLLLALAAAAALGAWLWRRRRPRPLYPVVLVHGLFGFDEIAVGKGRHAYFRGVGPALAREGRTVVHARLAPIGTIETRARELAGCIEGLAARRVIVLAHSMGGLDARWAIARLGLDRKVAALITVGTPHRGTPVADLTTDLAAKLGIARALELAGVGVEALRDLTSARLERFNEEAPDASSVFYACVVGSARRLRRTNPLLVPTHLWMADRHGANDGVVPASSQRWGVVLAEIEADHWAQIGWSRHFDAGPFYARLIGALEASGIRAAARTAPPGPGARRDG